MERPYYLFVFATIIIACVQCQPELPFLPPNISPCIVHEDCPRRHECSSGNCTPKQQITDASPIVEKVPEYKTEIFIKDFHAPPEKKKEKVIEFGEMEFVNSKDGHTETNEQEVIGLKDHEPRQEKKNSFQEVKNEIIVYDNNYVDQNPEILSCTCRNSDYTCINNTCMPKACTNPPDCLATCQYDPGRMEKVCIPCSTNTLCAQLTNGKRPICSGSICIKQ